MINIKKQKQVNNIANNLFWIRKSNKNIFVDKMLKFEEYKNKNIIRNWRIIFLIGLVIIDRSEKIPKVNKAIKKILIDKKIFKHKSYTSKDLVPISAGFLIVFYFLLIFLLKKK